MTRKNRKRIGWLLLIGSIIAMSIVGNKHPSSAPDTGALPAAWVEGMTSVILVACLIAGICLLVTRGKSED
jgi:hypothetical protein